MEKEVGQKLPLIKTKWRKYTSQLSHAHILGTLKIKKQHV